MITAHNWVDLRQRASSGIETLRAHFEGHAYERECLDAHLHDDIGLDDLAIACGVYRFRLTRAFKASFGLAPHAYLIQLRLAKARQWLARGMAPAEVAHALCFADQSHLGRWFRRAYYLTPGHYSKRCTNVPD